MAIKNDRTENFRALWTIGQRGGAWKKFKGFLGKVKKWVKGLATKFTKKFDRKVKGDLNDLQRVFDKMPGPKVNLKEAFVFDEQGLICEGLNQELRKLDIPKLNVVRQGIEKRLMAEFDELQGVIQVL